VAVRDATVQPGSGPGGTNVVVVVAAVEGAAVKGTAVEGVVRPGGRGRADGAAA
jgi:hypothetical protein